MLELFYFSDILDAKEKEEKKKAAEEKKKQSPTKIKEEKYPLEIAKQPEHKSIAEMMQNAKDGAKTLDLSQMPKELVDQYKLMLRLSDDVRKEKKGNMPYEPELFCEKYTKVGSNDPGKRLEEREARQ